MAKPIHVWVMPEKTTGKRKKKEEGEVKNKIKYKKIPYNNLGASHTNLKMGSDSSKIKKKNGM